MAGYGKIFSSVFTGSMFGSGPVVFAVWAYVIANAEPPGVVEINSKMLAAMIGTDVDSVDRAVDFLSSEDQNSRNPECDGRRLVKLTNMQYQVVSFSKYREMRDDDDRRRYQREWVAEKRRRQRSTSVDVSTDVDRSRPQSTKAEAEAEAVKESVRRKPSNADPEGFPEFYAAYPRKQARADAVKAWRKLAPDASLQARIHAALAIQRRDESWAKEGGKFIPLPATWLNGQRWEDMRVGLAVAAPSDRPDYARGVRAI